MTSPNRMVDATEPAPAARAAVTAAASLDWYAAWWPAVAAPQRERQRGTMRRRLR